MIFDDLLRDLVTSVPGGIAATIMGKDGLPVRSFGEDRPPFDIQTAGIEIGPLFFGIVRMQTGTPKEMVVTTDQVTIICCGITDDFFICLLVDRNGNPWKGRFKAQMLAPKLRSELT